MNFDKDIKKLSDSDLENINYYFRCDCPGRLPDNYTINVDDELYMSRELSDSILEYCRRESHPSHAYDNYVVLVKNSNYLTINDINRIIDHIFTYDSIVNTIELVKNISKYYPQYINNINYNKLLKRILPYFLEQGREEDIVAWLLINDVVGKIIVEYLAYNGVLMPYMNDLNRVMQEWSYHGMLTYYSADGTVFTAFFEKAEGLTVKDFISYYNLPHELFLGVNI